MTSPNGPARAGLSRRKAGIGCLVMVVLVLLVGGAFWMRYRQAVSIGRDRAIAALQNIEKYPPPTGGCQPGRGDLPRGESELHLQSGGQNHRYLLYVPESYDPNRPSPLVLSLHGTASSPEQQRDYTQWNAFADALGIIVVYPAGGFSFHSYTNPAMSPADIEQDLVFFQDLLAELEQTLCLDQDNYFITGFSSGGAMAVMLACRLPGIFSAVGTVSAPIWQNLFDVADCPADDLPPLVAFHGTADWIVSYTGGQAPSTPAYYGFESWTSAWAERIGCPSDPKTIQAPGNVAGRLWTSCPAEKKVSAYTVPGGGHAWPGGSPLLDMMLGSRESPFLATQAMWEFFTK